MIRRHSADIRLKLKSISDAATVERLAALEQFRFIENDLLFKIVKVGTGFEVSDRWAAIAAIICWRLPIPVQNAVGRR